MGGDALIDSVLVTYVCAPDYRYINIDHRIGPNEIVREREPSSAREKRGGGKETAIPNRMSNVGASHSVGGGLNTKAGTGYRRACAVETGPGSSSRQRSE